MSHLNVITDVGTALQRSLMAPFVRTLESPAVKAWQEVNEGIMNPPPRGMIPMTAETQAEINNRMRSLYTRTPVKIEGLTDVSYSEKKDLAFKIAAQYEGFNFVDADVKACAKGFEKMSYDGYLSQFRRQIDPASFRWVDMETGQLQPFDCLVDWKNQKASQESAGIVSITDMAIVVILVCHETCGRFLFRRSGPVSASQYDDLAAAYELAKVKAKKYGIPTERNDKLFRITNISDYVEHALAFSSSEIEGREVMAAIDGVEFPILFLEHEDEYKSFTVISSKDFA